MTLKLYYFPGACSLAPHIVLRETGIDFTLEKVDLYTQTTAGGVPFASINPKGQVPALLLEDGAVLTEVPAILQYLADRAPETGLAPATGTLRRARLQEWLNFITAEVHKGMSPLFNRDMPGEWRKVVIDGVAKKLAVLEARLSQAHYLIDDRFGIADSYAFAIIGWTRLFQIDLAPWPAIQAYMARLAERPSVRAAMHAEGLLGLAAAA